MRRSQEKARRAIPSAPSQTSPACELRDPEAKRALSESTQNHAALVARARESRERERELRLAQQKVRAAKGVSLKLCGINALAAKATHILSKEPR